MIVDVKWLTDVLNERQPEKTLDLSRKRICSVDLSGMNLSNIDFSCTRFENVDFTGANMDHCNVSRCFFVECSMRGVRLTNADASDASFLELDMQDSDFSGTNFYYAALEFINLENVKVNEKTKWFGDLFSLTLIMHLSMLTKKQSGLVMQFPKRVPSSVGRLVLTTGLSNFWFLLMQEEPVPLARPDESNSQRFSLLQIQNVRRTLLGKQQW